VKPSREFLGNDYSSFARRKVFLLVDALETDEYLFIRIERTRVYFDDVMAVTVHQERGIVASVATGLLTLFFGLMGIGLLVDKPADTRVGGYIMLFFAAAFGLLTTLRIVIPADVISVFGRRTNSRMRFWLRQRRAQEIYTRLVDQVRARQQKAVAAMPPPPAPPEVPMPPAPPAAAPPPAPEAPPPVTP
jgi:hypothetical protein